MSIKVTRIFRSNRPKKGGMKFLQQDDRRHNVTKTSLQTKKRI